MYWGEGGRCECTGEREGGVSVMEGEGTEV